jgi:16S rRNA (uracil1498-N3)-methyltransferase
MEIFFADPDKISNTQIVLDEFESKHILQTLKKKTGDILEITDGQGNLYRAKIAKPAKRLSLEYHQTEQFERTKPEISLAVGFIRPNRLDTLLEKCTEIGINHFILFRSQYANYISFNIERMNKILRQAIKQSVQFYLPTIKVIDQFKDFFKETDKFSIKIVAQNADSPALIDELTNLQYGDKTNIIIAIGPEGGFSEDEITDFSKNKFIPVSLGNTRLRTETAAITSASIIKSYIQYKKGDGFWE